MSVSETAATVEPLEPAPAASLNAEQRVVRFEVVVSGIRCLLMYIVIPVLAPVLGIVGIQRHIGVALSLVALGCIGFSIRRFFASNHRMRWGYAALSGVIALYLVVELVRDLVAVLS